MAIPPGTKFHGVAPGVDTADLGSVTVQALRDAYLIEDFGSPLSVTVTLSPAQMLALDTTPIEVVPAQGTGKSILVVSAWMTMAVFFAIGAFKSRWSLAPWWRSGLETFLIGGVAAGIAYFVGTLFSV